MAYDTVRKETVMYGGFGLSDTWVYDGKDWTKENPSSSPGKLYSHDMAFDEKRGVVVLHGGMTSAKTWEWDGTNWAEKHPVHSPGTLFSHNMTYDSGTLVAKNTTWRVMEVIPNRTDNQAGGTRNAVS